MQEDRFPKCIREFVTEDDQIEMTAASAWRCEAANGDCEQCSYLYDNQLPPQKTCNQCGFAEWCDIPYPLRLPSECPDSKYNHEA